MDALYWLMVLILICGMAFIIINSQAIFTPHEETGEKPPLPPGKNMSENISSIFIPAKGTSEKPPLPPT